MRPDTRSSIRRYEVQYQPVFVRGRTLAFPCDANGRIDLDTLCDRARNNYFYARAVVGREYRPPTVVPLEEACVVG